MTNQNITEPIQADFFDEVDNKIKYKLENFEGPLDLLLFLIKGNKLDIKTVKLSLVTSQYLEFMQSVETLDMEKASEFIEMAATLIEIKGKSLLPKLEIINPQEDEEQKLLLRLEEYKILKEASESLKQIENINRFYKEPDKSVGDFKVVLNGFSYDKLIDAFSKMLTRTTIVETEIKEREITRDRFTVAEKVATIKDIIRSKKKVVFSELFDARYTKSEIITTFMALLELLKMEQIKVKQSAQFGEIDIEINEDGFNDNVLLMAESI